MVKQVRISMQPLNSQMKTLTCEIFEDNFCLLRLFKRTLPSATWSSWLERALSTSWIKALLNCSNRWTLAQTSWNLWQVNKTNISAHSNSAPALTATITSSSNSNRETISSSMFWNMRKTTEPNSTSITPSNSKFLKRTSQRFLSSANSLWKEKL